MSPTSLCSTIPTSLAPLICSLVAVLLKSKPPLGDVAFFYIFNKKVNQVISKKVKIKQGIPPLPGNGYFKKVKCCNNLTGVSIPFTRLGYHAGHIFLSTARRTKMVQSNDFAPHSFCENASIVSRVVATLFHFLIQYVGGKNRDENSSWRRKSNIVLSIAFTSKPSAFESVASCTSKSEPLHN